MTSRAGTSMTRKLTRTPHGYSIYVLGESQADAARREASLSPERADRYDAHGRPAVPAPQAHPRKLSKRSPERGGPSYPAHPHDLTYSSTQASAPRTPRRSSSSSTEGRRVITPPQAPAPVRQPAYDPSRSTPSRNPGLTPSTQAGGLEYPFPPPSGHGAYPSQPAPTGAYGQYYANTAPAYSTNPYAYPTTTYAPVPIATNQPYGLPPAPTPHYGSYDLSRPREPSPTRGRPPLRRGDPYDMYDTPANTPMYEYDMPPQAPMLERRASNPSPPALARVDSRRVYHKTVRRDSADSWDGAASVRASVALEQLEEGASKYALDYAAHGYSTLQSARLTAAQYGARAPARFDASTPDLIDERGTVGPGGGFPPSPGSAASSAGSDIGLPRTPSPLAIDTAARSVRWNENLTLPSPVRHDRRKGWFNCRGDQLWTNSGAYKPPNAGEEYPPDLRGYPEPGHGYMNEQGVRIDMQHCRIPIVPMRSALKRRDS